MIGIQGRFALLLILLAGSPAVADDVEVELRGFIKLDALVSDYDGGDLPGDSALRDFHIPGAIPIGGVSEDSDTDFHAKETRLDLRVHKPSDGGPGVTARVEVDFLLSEAGNERVSNSYNPRVRHAYFTYDGWLFGQTWSTFMIVVLPEDLDFIGVPDGTTFGREPMIRYTRGPWQFALENPETTVTPNGGGARIVTDDVSIPEVVARYNHERDWGSLSAAAIYRSLELDDGVASAEDDGWGLTVGGKVDVCDTNDVVFQLTTGSGLGRHLALNTANGAVVTAAGDLESIDATAGFVGLRHRWNDRWRSSVNYAAFRADNDATLTGPDANKNVSSYSINLLYSPRPELTFGAELIHAEREIESGASGDMNRFQFSAKYAFTR